MPTTERLLLVEDDAWLRRSLVLTLTDEGFEVLAAATGAQGLAGLAGAPDAVLLDLGLPDVDGFELCSRLREGTASPVVVLTARRGPNDLTRAFAAGADDYLTKPVPTADLAGRVRTLLAQEPVGPWSLGDLVRSGATVTRAGQPVPVSHVELRVLSALAAEAGRTVDARALAARVWGSTAAPCLQALEARVGSLRAKLADRAGSWTVHARGGGYALSR